MTIRPSRSLPLSHLRPRRVLAWLAVVAACALPAAAQPDAGAAQRPIERVPGTMEPAARPMPIVDVNFPGGTVAEFVRAVQQAAEKSSAKLAPGGVPVNVLLPPEAARVEMPPLSLKGVSVDTALKSLGYVFADDSEHRFQPGALSATTDNALTFAISYRRGGRGGTSPPPPARFVSPPTSRAYSLEALLESPTGVPGDDPALRQDAETILAALKLAAELESTDTRVEPVQFLYHKDTRLVIVRGTEDQHRLIDGVLGQLTQTMNHRRAQARGAREVARHNELQLLDSEAMVQAARAQLDRAASEVRPAETQLARMQDLVKSGNASEVELERARAQFEVATANVAAAEAHLLQMRRRAEIFKSGDGALIAAPAGEQVLAVYDVRDLAAFKADLMDLVKQTIAPSGRMEVKPASGDSTGSLAVRATRAQHEVLVRAFNLARRLKANEPKLPGVTLDQLIKDDKKE